MLGDLRKGIQTQAWLWLRLAIAWGCGVSSHPVGEEAGASGSALQAEVALLLGRDVKVTETQLEILGRLERHQRHAPLLTQPGSPCLLMKEWKLREAHQSRKPPSLVAWAPSRVGTLAVYAHA